MSLRQPAPLTCSMARAIDSCEALGLLMERLARSKACFAVVSPRIPPELLADLRSGPLDDGTWTLLVENAAAASKLRQMVPRLEQALLEALRQPTAIKVRVQPRSAAR